MRKPDRLLTGILLPVSVGLSAQTKMVSPFRRDLTFNIITHSHSHVLSSAGESPCPVILRAYLLLHMIKFRIYH